MFDVREFLRWVEDDFERSVRVDEHAGHYARAPGESDIHLYGVADMACVLHTIGALHLDDAARAEWRLAFDGLQVADGWFVEDEPTHDRFHSTAFTVAAMELVGLRPTKPLTFARRYSEPAAASRFLSDLDWRTDVYMASHRGAGLGAIFSLDMTLGSADWFDAYFEALDHRLDPASGMHGEDKPATGDIDQVGGTFHYAFLYEWHHRVLAHPEARIDAVLGLQADDGFWSADSKLWITLDAVYLLARACDRSGHRRDDVRRAVRAALTAFCEAVLAPAQRDEHFGWYLGTHWLTAAVSVLAEAQRFLGADEVRTDRPLRLVLDRRPFV